MKNTSAKIVETYAGIQDISMRVRGAGKTLVTINGCFDIFHNGHIFFISRASEEADCLICCVNTDESVRRLKGAGRPCHNLRKRVAVLSTFRWIDYIVPFDEEDPRAVLEIIKPHVHCNGQEYGTDCIESKVVRRNGGRLVLIERQDVVSSTNILSFLRDPNASR